MEFDFRALHTDSKEEKYKNVLAQIDAIIAYEPNVVANLANICAVLKTEFQWFWIGFYLVDTPLELVLGPFQGSVACTRIAKGKGVCGTAWLQEQTIVVPDVDKFPGHIACSSLSRSEIVVPLIKEKEVIGVLDIDSDTYDSFNEVDAMYLEQLVRKVVMTIR